MAKKTKVKKQMEKGIIIFVEGETDKIFYQHLVKYWKEKYNSKKYVSFLKVINLQGIGKFESKAPNKFKQLNKSNPDVSLVVFCAYDTDVFELGVKPPVNWNNIESKLRKNGAKKVFHIKAKSMIEDWFLWSLDELSDYLKISPRPKSLNGKDAVKKMENLFKKANKVYTKGYACDDFINYLNLEVTCKNASLELANLLNEIFEDK